MTDAVALVQHGLERALVLHVGKLFEVLMSSTVDPAALERFRRGVEKALDAYTALTET